jgi:ketosteroid isomerase-like protein
MDQEARMSEALLATARAWLEAFNGRDLDRLLALYAEDAVHVSPKLRERRPETEGRVVGRAALRAWWEDAFRRLPGLRYEPISLTADDARVWMEYRRLAPGEPPMLVAELLVVRNAKIVESRVYHG